MDLLRFFLYDINRRPLHAFPYPPFPPVFNTFIPYKSLALVLFILETIGHIILLRMSRIYFAEEPYISSTAVAMAEVIKVAQRMLKMVHHLFTRLPRSP